MAGNPKITIDIISDGSDARKDVEKTTKSFEGMKGGIEKASGVIAGSLLGFGAVATDMAADAELAATSVDRAFGTASATVHQFAQDASSNVGISTQAYESLAATFGTAVQGMGLDAQSSARATNDLLVAAGDLALATGVEVPDAASAMGAALRGEFDALGEFGVNVNAATVEAGLAAKGITDPTTGLAPAIGSAQYQQELLNQVMALSGTTYAGYRGETETTAEKTQDMKAKFEDATTQLGTAFLPMLGDVADALSDGAGFIVEHKDTISTWLPILAAAAGAVWVLNWALAANPWVLAIIGVAVLTGALITFRTEITDWVMGALTSLNDTLSSGDWWNTQLQEALGFLGLSADDFTESLDNISSALSTVWDWFSKNWSFQLPSVPLPGAGTFSAAPSGFGAVPGGTRSATMLRAGGTSGPVAGANITIQVGVGDPDAIARTIQSVVGGRVRRSGPVIL